MGRIERAAVVVAVCAIGFLAPPELAGAETLHRVIDNLSFGPEPIAAHVGDVIEWSNHDFVAHTVTARDGGFDAFIAPGKSATIVVKHAGKIAFYCRVHPNMTGVIDATR